MVAAGQQGQSPPFGHTGMWHSAIAGSESIRMDRAAGVDPQEIDLKRPDPSTPASRGSATIPGTPASDGKPGTAIKKKHARSR